jgi:hydrogenase nickel incorporation protein HypA/HybF
MHERSLVKALLRQVEAIADQHSAGRVSSIHIRVGEFSGVEADLLSSAYDDLVHDSPLCGASLCVERVPLEATCEQCGKSFRVERFNFQCGNCGSLKLSIHGGEEMLLESVTLVEAET